jgi:hypothetical protein
MRFVKTLGNFRRQKPRSGLWEHTTKTEYFSTAYLPRKQESEKSESGEFHLKNDPNWE